MVRSHGRSPHRAPSRPAHRRQPPLRARRRLQRRPRRLGSRQQHSARQRRHHRRRSRRRARPGIRSTHRASQARSLSRSAKSTAFWARPIDKEGITAATVEATLVSASAASSLPIRRRPMHGKSLCPVGASISSAKSTSSKRSRASTATTASPTRCPSFGEGVSALPWAEAEAAVRRTLLAAGFHEAIASTFCSAAEAALTAPQPGLVVPLGNPLSEEAGVLRPSLVPGMLAMIAGNLHRDVSDVRLFELGTVFSGTTEKVEERPALAFGAAGALAGTERASPPRAPSISTMSRAWWSRCSRASSRARLLRPLSRRSRPHAAWLHPYRSARVVVDGLTVGWFGQLHPSEAAARKLKEPVLVGELYLDRLYKLPLAQARRAGNFALPACAARFFAGSGSEHRVGDRSIRRSRRCRFPNSSTGARAKYFAMRGWARRSTRCCSAPPFRRPIARCAKKSCKAFQAQVVEAVGKAGARLAHLVRMPSRACAQAL